MDRLLQIINFINDQPDIKITKNFECQPKSGGLIEGSISIEFEPLSVLEFAIQILPQYPLQFQNHESIFFKNIELIEYLHVMEDGIICIHTSHSVNLAQKLKYDFNSLRLWIKDYYVNAANIDEKYEHIMTPLCLFEDNYYSLSFNNTGEKLKSGEYGIAYLSEVRTGIYKGKAIRNFYLESLRNNNSKIVEEVEWNPRIKSFTATTALYTVIDKIPADYGKFTFKKWKQLEPLLNQKFIDYLHSLAKKSSKKDQLIYLLIGYKLPSREIHWEMIILKAGELPFYGIKKTDKTWESRIDGEQKIVWGNSHNISYKYFFGRGQLNDRLTTGKILIIGLGATGSMVATTLVRGGCTNLCIADYDEKYPENICRSEYTLNPLVSTKTEDLREQLYAISPYVSVISLTTELKGLFSNTKENIQEYEKFFDSFDFVFDCSTDNDLLYLVSQLNLKNEFFSFSITNKAVQLVCACEGDLYNFSQTQFNNVLKYDIEDLHEPMGCWNSTFKASYNDINMLVQTAIKHINLKIENKKSIANFVIETSFQENLKITVNEF